MKILVVSDIHACAIEKGKPKRSYVDIAGGVSTCAAHQFLSFTQENPAFHPDVIICPGDLADSADQAGLKYAWEFLNKLRGINSDALLLTTVGNHDIDSRYQNSDFNAKGVLDDLDPVFPFVPKPSSNSQLESKTSRQQFWADNFYIVTTDQVRFVVLNSAAFHGHGASLQDKPPEFTHGRITPQTVHALKKAIKESNDELQSQGKENIRLNVLVCHHHLEKNGHITDSDYSEMKGASELLRMLSDFDYGRWLVIHGHRHHADLFYTGGNSGPYVISAASFSATRTDHEASPNQAHLIELNLDEMSTERLFPCGNVKSFTWNPGAGWMHHGAESGGLPPETNFGYRGSSEELAFNINAVLTSEIPFIEWNELCDKVKHLKYIAAEQIEDLKKVLKKDYNITLKMNEDRLPTQCGRAE